MKQLFTLAAVVALTVSTSALANAHKEAPGMAMAGSAPMTKQQSKMGACNKDAADKKGDERKAFMKSCLSAGKPMTQQDKMKKCNTDATGKKGDERKTYMKECLSA